MSIRRWVLYWAMGLFCAGPFAQSFPTKPIRLVMPFPATGPADLMARIYAQKLTERWGQSVLVDNRVGATGTIGADIVAKATPDGHTLLFTVDLPIVMAPALIKTPYDPRAGFTPIAILAETMNMLVVHPSLAVSNLSELIAAAKKRPGQLTYSSAGQASPAHLCGEMLRVNAGIDIVHVPYKGAAPAMNAVLAGEVSMFCGPITQGLAHVKGGKLKAIGVTGSSISGLVPELPTLSTTIPGLVVSSTYMVYAPPATPANIAQLIKTDLRKTWEDKDVRERLGAMGMDLIWLEGAELTRRVDADLAKWSNVIKTAGIRAE